MAKVRLSKTFLLQQRAQLSLYRRLLPSLDLKRRQLVVELERARQVLLTQRAEVTRIEEMVGRELPMLARTELAVDRLIQLQGVDYGIENVVGVKLPVLKQVRIGRARYGLLTKPAWVDALVQRLQDGVRARFAMRVAERRVELLQHAVRRMTQRVNLFERVLIPQATENIRRAQIVLGDRERASVVRSKLAKSRQQALG